MNALVLEALEILVRAGPGLVLLLAFLETVFITGLVMPTGPVIILSTLLAGGIGTYGLESVVLGAVLGGALGDSGGFWVGRRFGQRVLRGKGFLGRTASRHLPRAVSLAGRHPLIGVGFARMVSFVRTLTPPLAGMSRISYVRFLAYDLPGVACWAAAYVGVGLLAGEGWRVATRWIGAAWVALFLVGGFVLWLFTRWRRRPSGRRTEGEAGIDVPC